MLPHIQRKKNSKLRQKEQRKAERKRRTQFLYAMLQEEMEKEAPLPERRLRYLDEKYGVGKGPIKERERWMKKLSQRQTVIENDDE